jgi:quinol monooxygenase YgiN
MVKNPVTVLARVQAAKGMVDQVRRECLALVAPSRKDDGCIDYELYESADDPTVFIFIENWLSRDHLDRHLQMPHCLAFDERTAGMLADSEEITFLKKLSH